MVPRFDRRGSDFVSRGALSSRAVKEKEEEKKKERSLISAAYFIWKHVNTDPFFKCKWSPG
jgi:hypothetical protein